MKTNNSHRLFLRGVMKRFHQTIIHSIETIEPMWEEDEPDLLHHDFEWDIRNELVCWMPIKEDNVILYLTRYHFYMVQKCGLWVRYHQWLRTNFNNSFHDTKAVSVRDIKVTVGKEFLQYHLDKKV